MSFLSKKSIIVTGGTGTFGKSLIKRLLKKHSDIKSITVFSRDEHKQFEMEHELDKPTGKINFVLGDVRDKESLLKAFKDADCVIHAAALKHVPIGEKNPFEFIKTNVIGSQNVLEAAVEAGVSQVIATSTDKASSPANLYGASKMCSEKLFIAEGIRQKDCKISVIRFGNFFGSRGSIVPKLLGLKDANHFPITHPDMTRFSLTTEEAVDFTLKTMTIAQGGEIFVPKMPSFKVIDLAKAIDPEKPVKIIGRRPGEKIHEEVISEFETGRLFENQDSFLIVYDSLRKLTGYTEVTPGFHYYSEQSPRISSQELMKAIGDVNTKLV